LGIGGEAHLQAEERGDDPEGDVAGFGGGLGSDEVRVLLGGCHGLCENHIVSQRPVQ